MAPAVRTGRSLASRLTCPRGQHRPREGEPPGRRERPPTLRTPRNNTGPCVPLLRAPPRKPRLCRSVAKPAGGCGGHSCPLLAAATKLPTPDHKRRLRSPLGRSSPGPPEPDPPQSWVSGGDARKAMANDREARARVPDQRGPVPGCWPLATTGNHQAPLCGGFRPAPNSHRGRGQRVQLRTGRRHPGPRSVHTGFSPPGDELLSSYFTCPENELRIH